MKYNKYSAIASLVFTLVPFISAIITNYVSLPFSQESSFKVIMTTLFIISWFFLAHVVSSLPEETLQKIKLLKSFTDDMQGYWYVKYNSNSYISCSFIKICDNCEGKTTSIVIDYNLDLTEKKILGVNDWKFDGDEKLCIIYLSGHGRHSFIRATYRAGDYDLTRIDDTGSDTVKVTGELIHISADKLRRSGICEDEKIANRMLRRFKLTEHNIEQLIEYMHETDESNFAKEILHKHNMIKIQRLRNSQFSITSRSELGDEISSETEEVSKEEK